MRFAEFIRDNHQRTKTAQMHLIDKFEPTFRNWSGTVNKKLAEALELRSYLNLFDIHTSEADTWLKQYPSLECSYKNLQKNLGKDAYIGEWYIVDQYNINQFANVTGDKQWIHTNPDRARYESPFKTTIAHGFLTLSLIPLLTGIVGSTDESNFSHAKMIVNYGLNRVRFPRPVKVGEKIRARTRVIDLILLKRGLEVVREVIIEVANSTRPACVAYTVLRLYF
ncbi:MAG: MaoC family dehydratase [Piscirickettsiaceae bacterium]|nr:MaoC family dehydratase [Piscirickettsiaceae bacterium]